MINSIKSEIEKRTGVPASTVDQVLNSLGDIVSERFPQYAGLIGGVLGIPTSGGATGQGAQAASGQGGMPDLGALGGLFGGAGGTGGTGGNQDQGGQSGQGGGTSGSTPV